MSKEYKINSPKLVKVVTEGGVGVLPTDTLYGIVCSAKNKKSVEHVYELRERNLKKPSIILISDIKDLKFFNIKPDKRTHELLSQIWPGKVSVILPCVCKKCDYLHRGTKSLAFRLPDKTDLVGLIKKTGPLIAPSANLEGLLPATTIKEAHDYFEDAVDFYVSGGKLESLPSTIVEIKKGNLSVKRQGAVAIKIAER
ncbi:MAG: threonylcarbamoyl-AMP synthase [Candidatus Moranbacteria bacterium RBG_19FT_COMBO_42_6]|nr:MAG: threonylcarbamoyl-AMP synthase [Candidatus Moranbacteria bacterium RBG_19FT_COMBO_42_6]